MNPAEQAPDLARIAKRTLYLLLDFDGPVCKVFTDPTARTVTALLRALINAHGVNIPQEGRTARPTALRRDDLP